MKSKWRTDITIKVISPKTGKCITYLIPQSKKLCYDKVNVISVMATNKDGDRYTKFLTSKRYKK